MAKYFYYKSDLISFLNCSEDELEAWLKLFEIINTTNELEAFSFRSFKFRYIQNIVKRDTSNYVKHIFRPIDESAFQLDLHHFPQQKNRLIKFAQKRGYSIDNVIWFLNNQDYKFEFKIGLNSILSWEMMFDLFEAFEKHIVNTEPELINTIEVVKTFPKEATGKPKRINRIYFDKGFEYEKFEDESFSNVIPNLINSDLSLRVKKKVTHENHIIDTIFSDDEAMLFVGGLENGTAKQIWRRIQLGTYTIEDILYAHKYAMNSVEKYGLGLIETVLKFPPVPFRYGNFTKLFSEFDRKAKKGYNPILELRGENGKFYSIMFYSEQEDTTLRINKNVLVIKDAANNQLFARVHRNGRILPSLDSLTVPILNILIRIGKNPGDYNLYFGFTGGTCLFCNRPLTDDISLKLGYGQTCARYNGMYWGA